MIPLKTKYSRTLNLGYEEVLRKMQESQEFLEQLTHADAIGHSSQLSSNLVRFRVAEDYFKLHHGASTFAHVRFEAVDNSSTNINITFSGVSLSLKSILNVLVVALVLTISCIAAVYLFYGSITPAEWLDLLLSEHSMKWAIVAITTVVINLVILIYFLFNLPFFYWSMCDILKSVSNTYNIDNKW